MPTTLIIGNGLGMAINPDKFRLDNAIKRVWTAEHTCLNQHARSEIQRLVGINNPTGTGVPTSEDELIQIYRFQRSTRELQILQREPRQWVGNDAVELSSQINYFLAAVAHEFYIPNDFTHASFDQFTLKLCEYIKSQDRVHVGTLNYDNLIYSKFVQHQIFGRFNETRLVDGFTGNPLTYNETNMERRFGNQFGWYLPLHGSPMFVSGRSPNEVNKMGSNSVRGFLKSVGEQNSIPSFHIVLTAHQFKSDAITGSRILSSYWEHLRLGLAESKRLLLIGYGGRDGHLNATIREWVLLLHKLHFHDFDIQIITYRDRDDSAFWAEQLLPGSLVDLHSDKITVHPMDNILDFDLRALKAPRGPEFHAVG